MDMFLELPAVIPKLEDPVWASRSVKLPTTVPTVENRTQWQTGFVGVAVKNSRVGW